MKNYVKEGQKLPLFGIGPYLIGSLALLSLIGIILSGNVLESGKVNGTWLWIFVLAGVLFTLAGVFIWYKGALGSGMDDHIENNKLKTDGIYSWIRNPMYTGVWFIITGITLMWHNVWLLILFPVDWLILTIVLKNTEEKWLMNLYGTDYAEYKSKVNRCIPVKRIRK